MALSSLLLTDFSGWALYLGLTAAGALVFFVTLYILKKYIAPASPEDRKNLVQLVFQVLGASVILLGVYFTWQELKTSQEGQITERFTRAIDQLGKADEPSKEAQTGKQNTPSKENNLAIRLGGIYSLERIARDSQRDYWPIMEVLTAYVRQNSPATAEAESETGNSTDLKADIQAILRVITRRRFAYRDGEDQRLDLSGINIRWAMLDEANLDGAILKSSLLDFASLKKAKLREAMLTDTRLQEAFLNGAQFQKADLRGAKLYKAHLAEADFTGADLRGADLREADGLTQNQLDKATTDENTLTTNLRPGGRK